MITGDELLDPDASRDYLRGWQERAERAAATTRAARDRLAALRATAPDGNGLTEVTVDSTGTLLGIRFTDRIQRVPPEAVARAVLTASRTARHRAADQAKTVIAETLGPGSATGRAITAQIENGLTVHRTEHGLPNRQASHGLTDRQASHGLTDRQAGHGLTDRGPGGERRWPERSDHG